MVDREQYLEDRVEKDDYKKRLIEKIKNFDNRDRGFDDWILKDEAIKLIDNFK